MTQLAKNSKIHTRTHKRSYSGQQFNQINLRKQKHSVNKLQKSVCLTSVKVLKQNKNDLSDSLFCRNEAGLAINSSLFFKTNFSVRIFYVLGKQSNFDQMMKSYKPHKDGIMICSCENRLIVQKNGVKHFHDANQFINYSWIQIILGSEYSLNIIELTQQKSNKVINLSLKDIKTVKEVFQSKLFRPLELIEEGNKLRALKLQSSAKKKISWASATTQTQNFAPKRESIQVDSFQQKKSKQDQNNLRNCQNKLNIGSNIKRKILKDYQSDIKRKLTFDIFAKPEKTKLNEYFQQNTKNIQKLQKSKKRIQSKYDKQNTSKIEKLQFLKQKNIPEVESQKKRKTINSKNVLCNDLKKGKEFGYMQKSIQIRKNINKCQFF